MNEVKHLRRIVISLLFLLEVVYFAACGYNQPFSPSATEDLEPVRLSKPGPGRDGDGREDPNPNSTLLTVRRREADEEGTSTAVIGPQGGVLIHAAHRIEVPAGALSEPVELTFSMPVSDTLMFDLGPDGIKFNAPVNIVFNWDHTYKKGLDQHNFTIAVFNPVTQVWDKITTTADTELNEARGNTDHFSRYAISKTR